MNNQTTTTNQTSTHSESFSSKEFDVVVGVLEEGLETGPDAVLDGVGVEVGHHVLEGGGDVEADVGDAVLAHAEDDGEEEEA